LLSPNADPGDGSFEIVLVPEDDRQKLADYVKSRIAGEEASFDFPVIPGSKVEIHTEDTLLHTDDELISLEEPVAVTIELQPGILEFMISGKDQ
jgi:diacylglycerol kinase (ATP)